MADNLAYQEEDWEELLDGEVVLMSPRPRIDHNRIALNIANSLKNQIEGTGKPCETFVDGTDVYLGEKDRVIPDVMIICKKEIIREDGIHGAPSLIVEILSPSTRKRDKGYKKDLYERYGVLEYWIVSPTERTVEVYLLEDGQYRLDEVYELPSGYDSLDKEEQKIYKTVIPVSLYDDVFVPLKSMFRNVT